ncbi:MAG: diguanylate cyclase [Deltaproteobacteria bacterium]|nr:diguanylate cyclase [Deltaproteobacteria bacterium]
MTTGTVLVRDIAENGSGVAVPVDATLKEMVRKMSGNGKGVVIVLEGKKAVGILTERDVVRLLYAGSSPEETADHIARKPIVSVDGERTIGHALNLLVENGIRRLVVVDDSGNFLGIVTHKDLLRHLEDDYYRSTLKVKHIFDGLKNLVSVKPADPITEVLRTMVEHRISAVPILERGKPIGIITEKDILRMADEGVPLREEVSRHMSGDVVSAGLETGVIEVVRTMNSMNIGRVVVTDPDGLAIGMITNRDIARNIEGDYNDFLERKFRQTKEFLNMLPEMMLEVINMGDAQTILWTNDAVASRFGREVVGKPVYELIPKKRWDEIISTLVRQKKVDNVRFKKDDRIYECSGFYMPLDRVSDVGRAQLMIRDITEEVILATTDPLTGAYNRRFMSEFLARETDRSIRTNKEFALILADLDHFKRVNDTYGHPAGDIVLKAVVEAMTTCTRQYDLVGRYGGEEFLIILPEIDKEKAAEIAERIRKRIESREIEIAGGKRLSVTASFGVAHFGVDGRIAEDLLVKVDERLYRAKREGRNRVVSPG